MTFLNREYVVDFGQSAVVLFSILGSPRRVFLPGKGIVVQLRIFKERVYGIQAKAGDTVLLPPAGHVKHGGFDQPGYANSGLAVAGRNV